MAIQARYVLAAVASLAYVAGSQWLMVRSPTSSWTAVALLSPMLAVVGIWAWRSGQRFLALCALTAIAALLARAWQSGEMAADRLYVAQHVAIHLGLAAWFGGTLRPGQTPLISMLAERVHRSLTGPMRSYTRRLTLAWTIYFLSIAALSILLHASAPFEAWATFANLLTPVALGLMFGGEYLLRYRLHPEFERVSMLDAVRAYMQPPAQRGSTPPDEEVP